MTGKAGVGYPCNARVPPFPSIHPRRRRGPTPPSTPPLHLPHPTHPIPTHSPHQNKRLAAPKQAKKEESKRGKKVKFDPANMKSVTELQKERAEKEKQEKAQRRSQETEEAEEEEEEEDSENDEDMEESDDDEEEEEGGVEDDDEEEEEEEEEEGASAAPSGKPASNGHSTTNNKSSQAEAKKPPAAARGPLSLVGTTPRAKSIEELKERLRVRRLEEWSRVGGRMHISPSFHFIPHTPTHLPLTPTHS